MESLSDIPSHQDPLLSSTLNVVDETPSSVVVEHMDYVNVLPLTDIVERMDQMEGISDFTITYPEVDSEDEEEEDEQDNSENNRPYSVLSSEQDDYDAMSSVSSAEDVNPDVDIKTIQPVLKELKKTNWKKTRRGPKKAKANIWSELKRNGVIKETTTECKLYEQKSFEDPKLERCRKNALSAKLNREKKKQEQEKIVKEMETLRSNNKALMKRVADSDMRAQKLEAQLARMEKLLREQSMSNLVAMTSCRKKHTTSRSRAACSVCSQGKAKA